MRKPWFMLVLLVLLAVVAVVVILFQQQTINRLREENQTLSNELRRLEDVRVVNERLSNRLAQTSNSPKSNSQENNELLRLRSEVTLLRRQLSQPSSQDQAQPTLQPVPVATQFQVDLPGSNALFAGVMLENPDAIANGRFVRYTNPDGTGLWYFQGTNSAGRSIFTIHY